ncbi:MbcA/ParS/Xre antitoxin family protein [Nitrospirillum pindoramense]|uniref:Uncharacterized protein DUF2384 n=1 Tax=Nitrospirillum amazonense TaxID=28077 RepID=A0A560H8A8_9PROT|nr:MbcA/ParS/Xre antitoxin family protein [Nitrospirillum amazonense]TWB42577.1 uncharacterized protein DUF2384 [Nitrospirillum amazonense]
MTRVPEAEGPFTGPKIVAIENLTRTDFRRVSAPGMRAFLAIATSWGLTLGERINVLGKPGKSTYGRWVSKARSGADLTLPLDVLLRISAVLGIYRSLRTVFARDEDGLEWLRCPNTSPLFGGQPPLALVINATQDGIILVRRHLDAWRGGLFNMPVHGFDDVVKPIADDGLVFR